MLTAIAEHHPPPAPAGRVVSSAETRPDRRPGPQGARLVWLGADPATSRRPRRPAQPPSGMSSHLPAPAKPRSAGTSRPAGRGAVFLITGRRSRPRPARSVAHGAGDPVVTIVDFRFTPATTTVHVGDTVTWTNDGSMPHSATARDGSFDTGILNKGQSASHTFTAPGTFSYFCRVHPFMHGTIVVLAGGSAVTRKPTGSRAPSAPTPTGPSAPAASPAPAGPAAPVATGPTLPRTGMDLTGAVCAGLLLLGCGSALRRFGRSSELP